MITEIKYLSRNKPTKEDLKKHGRYHEFKENRFLKRVYEDILKENL